MAIRRKNLIFLGIFISTLLLAIGTAVISWRLSQPTAYVPEDSLAGNNCCNTGDYINQNCQNESEWTQGFYACANELCGECKNETKNDGDAGDGNDKEKGFHCVLTCHPDKPNCGTYYSPAPCNGAPGNCEQVEKCPDGDENNCNIVRQAECDIDKTPVKNNTDNRGKAICTGLDDGLNQAGKTLFEIKQGQSLEVKLYPEIKSVNGVKVASYRYAIKDGFGSINPKGNSTQSSVTWTLSASDSASLEPGTYEVVAASTTDEEDLSSGGFGSDCVASIQILPSKSTIVLSETSSSTCADDASKATVTYTAIIRNSSTKAARVTEVQNHLDRKISKEMIKEISDNGTFDEEIHAIIWNKTVTVTADRSRVFTYKVEYNNDDFDSYKNTLTASVPSGDHPEAAENVNIVNCALPQTAEDDNGLIELAIFSFILVVIGIVLVRFDVIKVLTNKQIPEEKPVTQVSLTSPTSPPV